MSKGRIAVVIPDFVRRQHDIPTGVQVKVTLEEVVRARWQLGAFYSSSLVEAH
jgi:hypothetical protein